MTSETTKGTARYARLALGTLVLASASGCVFDEESSLHRDSALEVEVVSGTPTCEDLGYPSSATVEFDPATSGTQAAASGRAVTLEADGLAFDFSASPGVDAVVAQVGSTSKIYRYTPQTAGDVGLSAPLPDSRAGAARAPDRIQFCSTQSGCTQTRHYWKSHSAYGPASYDDTWAHLPQGADTPFFHSEKSYYEVLWTRGVDEPYYELAHAYIAAELSELAGADAQAVAAELEDAAAIFAALSPEDVARQSPKTEVRQEMDELTAILSDFSRGALGPGSCAGDTSAGG